MAKTRCVVPSAGRHDQLLYAAGVAAADVAMGYLDHVIGHGVPQTAASLARFRAHLNARLDEHASLHDGAGRSHWPSKKGTAR
jgi:hypothetical protein